MDFAEVKRSVGLLFSLYMTTALSKEKFLLGEDLPPGTVNGKLLDQQGWDDCWNNHRQGGRILYDVIAAFYRKLIIKRTRG